MRYHLRSSVHAVGDQTLEPAKELAANDSRSLAIKTTMPKAEEPATRHLLELPPELRNRIYEYVFGEVRDFVDLLDAMPPAKSLALVNRMIHSETLMMYKTVYRDYRRNSCFRLNLVRWSKDKAESRLEALRVEDVNSIQQMRITVAGSNGLELGTYWLEPDRSWLFGRADPNANPQTFNFGGPLVFRLYIDNESFLPGRHQVRRHDEPLEKVTLSPLQEQVKYLIDVYGRRE